MKHIRCWEYMKCGRQHGGAMAEKLGGCTGASCPHSECWLIAGTLCNSEVLAMYAQKYESCIICNYYNRMQEYHTKRPRMSFFLFGQYLCRQGLITHDQSIQLAPCSSGTIRRSAFSPKAGTWSPTIRSREFLSYRKKCRRNSEKLLLNRLSDRSPEKGSGARTGGLVSLLWGSDDAVGCAKRTDDGSTSENFQYNQASEAA